MDDHQFMDEAIAELDRLRDEAQAAFIARDVPGYMRIFSPYVKYERTNEWSGSELWRVDERCRTPDARHSVH
jgi:hypothetical protein